MKRYERQSNLSIYWYNKSSDLRGSAGALWASMNKEHSDNIVQELSLGTGYRMSAAVLPVYEMLCGMAMELIYKAILIANGLNPKDFKHHKLIVLANLAGITVDDKSNLILQLLTESIIWDGKYPVPNNENKMENRDKLFGKLAKGSLARANDALNWESFNRRWLEASNIYWDAVETGTTTDR